MDDTIFAFTEHTGDYPPYIDFTRLENGKVRVTVRSAPKPQDGMVWSGETSSIELDAETVANLVECVSKSVTV